MIIIVANQASRLISTHFATQKGDYHSSADQKLLSGPQASSEPAQDRRAWGASIRDVVNAIGDVLNISYGSLLVLLKLGPNSLMSAQPTPDESRHKSIKCEPSHLVNTHFTTQKGDYHSSATTIRADQKLLSGPQASGYVR